MTTVRPPRPSPAPDPSDSAKLSAPRSVTVGVRRLFGTESSASVIVFGTTMFLVLFGLVMVLSSSSIVSSQSNDGDFFAVFLRQGTLALLGIPMMLIIARLPAWIWRRWARVAVIVGVGLQALVVFTPLGYAYGGNRNWLDIGGFTAQPSEFLKLALIVWLASILADRSAEGFSSWRSVLLPAAPLSILSIGMVLLGQDLGTAAIMLMIVIGAFFFAGVPVRFLTGIVVTVAALAVIVAMSTTSRSNRIGVWLNGCAPEDYEFSCWQTIHGTWALGSGGLFGVGLGNSAAKWSWLPHAESDYIFAVIGEELGLVGAVVVLLMFSVLALGFVRLIRGHTDPFRRIATGAIMTWLIGQAFVNIAVVLGMLPVLGVPLPLISAGGSALLSALLAIGVALSLARDSPPAPAMAGRVR